MACPLNDSEYLEKKYIALENFLINIFSQEKDEALRRIRFFCAENHEKYLKEYYNKTQKTPDFIKTLKNKLFR